MIWLVLGAVAVSVLYWGNTTFNDESYMEFLGRQVGTFLGAVNGAIETSKKKKKTSGENKTQKDS